MNADDDGVVEAFNVISTTGCTEDDLKVLVAKGFVTVLNEDLVSYIVDWRENNRIRSDRKIDSIYKDLLISMNPSIELLEARERADRRKNDAEKQCETSGTSQKHTWDGIGKDRLGKDRLGESTTDRKSSRRKKDDFCDGELLNENKTDYMKMFGGENNG
jgi:hypothetical protein